MKYEILENIGLMEFGQVRTRVDNYRSTLVTQGLSDATAGRMADLCVLSTAELEMAFRSPSLTVQQRQLPFVVAVQTLRLGVFKTDTQPDWPCETSERLEQRAGLTNDAFLYDSDHQKFSAAFAEGIGVSVGNYADAIELVVTRMENTVLGGCLRKNPLNSSGQSCLAEDGRR